jgi:hypothetical protein
LRKFKAESARLYATIGQKYPWEEDSQRMLQSFAAENGKHVTQIQRAYNSVITDAIEGAYAFDVDVDEYRVAAEVPAGATR